MQIVNKFSSIGVKSEPLPQTEVVHWAAISDAYEHSFDSWCLAKVDSRVMPSSFAVFLADNVIKNSKASDFALYDAGSGHLVLPDKLLLHSLTGERKGIIGSVRTVPLYVRQS